MNHIKPIAIAFVLMGTLASCIKDDSTLPNKPISEIVISSSSDTINIDYGYELVYEPSISQTEEDMELSYEWAYQGMIKNTSGAFVKDSLRVASTERVFRHTFKQLGEYRLRLKVSNEHGSSFKNYVLNVKAPFDQGIFVLSADENKNGRVSFMRPLVREEIEAGKEEFFYTSAFKTVNPGYPLNDPTDAEKIGPDIFISSRADNLIYRIDSHTFDLYNITDFKEEFPNLKPVRVMSKDRSITNYITMSENGGFANVNYKSDIAFKNTTLFANHTSLDKYYVKYTGVPIPPSTSITNMRCYHYFLEYDKSMLYYLYDLNRPAEVELADLNLINVVQGRDLLTCVVGVSKTDPDEVVIVRGTASTTHPLNGRNEYRYKANNITLSRSSLMQSNNLYNAVFYTNQNRMYRWYNWNASPQLPTTPIIQLSPNQEITCFDFSLDGREMYVGIYDSTRSGLKGSIYVYGADALDPSTNQLVLKKKYEGVADKPIKVFWKTNRK